MEIDGSNPVGLAPTTIHPWVAEGQRRVRFGVSIYPQPPDWQGFVRHVRWMEEHGIDGYFAYDHPAANVDCWSALAALAAATDRIRLGTAIDCVLYRPVYLLARQAADVDRISGGRLVLGIGIGDKPEEFAEMGLPYPSVRRGSRHWRRRSSCFVACGLANRSRSPGRRSRSTRRAPSCRRCRSRTCRS